MADAVLREGADLTARWMDTVIRPDLYPPPEAASVAASVQQKPKPTQAKPADEAPLWENAEEDAAALLGAFQGLGTTDQVVYRVLNQPPEVVKAVLGVYDNRYNRHTGQGLIEDLRAEFDELGGQADWHFVIGQLTRAGIAVPDAALRYARQEPAAEHRAGVRIVASPNVRVAVPGTRIFYELDRGTDEQYSLSSPYRYQWYVLNDPVTINTWIALSLLTRPRVRCLPNSHERIQYGSERAEEHHENEHRCTRRAPPVDSSGIHGRSGRGTAGSRRAGDHCY